MKPSSSMLDYFASSLSALCVLHCLLLPVLAVSLPIMGVISEAEWLHRLFVLTAVPISALAFSTTSLNRTGTILMGVSAVGCGLLVLGAFVESLHDHETLLTVAGAVMLGAAHLLRVALRRTHRHSRDIR